MEDLFNINTQRIERERRDNKKVIGYWKKLLEEQTLPGGDVVPAIPHYDEKSHNDLWLLTTQMFENQATWNPRRQDAFEATVATDISLPVKFAFPVIRQIFPKNILNKICLIRPLASNSGGKGQVFYWKYYRTDDESEITTSDGYSDWSKMASETTVPRQINAKMTYEDITAERRQLSAVYSQTAAEDLMGAMQIDIEQENYFHMAGEILRETEQVGILGINSAASAGSVTWSPTVPDGVTAFDHYQTLYNSLIDAEIYVSQLYFRECNYIICGLGFAGYLRKSNRFASLPGNTGPGERIQSGVNLIGSLEGHWDVYSTPLMPTNSAFMSFYPTDMTHGGAVWAPYVPMTRMPKVYAGAETRDDGGQLVNNDQWTLNVRTRQAFEVLLPNMFSKITIS